MSQLRVVGNMCGSHFLQARLAATVAVFGLLLPAVAFPSRLEAQEVPAPPWAGMVAPGATGTAGVEGAAGGIRKSASNSSATTTAVSLAPQAQGASAAPAKLPTNRQRKRAARLYLYAGKLFLSLHYEEAVEAYQKASALDPANQDYRFAIDVARSHAVTALVEQANQLRIKEDKAGERIALTRARAFDPASQLVRQHLDQMRTDSLSVVAPPLYTEERIQPAPAVLITPTSGQHSFHLYADLRQIAREVFRAWGLEATLDDSVRNERVRFDLDNATFQQAVDAFELISRSFYVPLDPHRVLVARDSREIRQQYSRQEVETIYLNGLTTAEITEMGNIAKNVFQIGTAGVDASANTLTLRATPAQLDEYNRTLKQLLVGHSQLFLDVSILQVAHTSERATGVQLPQSMSAFNVYAEEQSIMSANSELVAEIISSGLASADNPLAILAILIADGKASSSLLQSALFGGGITQNALSPGTVTLNLNVNSSDSKQIDHILLRVGDGDNAASTFKLGTRYPIQTSSYSSLSDSTSSIAGLTTSGTSSALSSLLSSLSSTAATPMVEYQEIGLTLKSTASVTRSDNVALSIDFKLDAMSGQFMNGNPVLNSRAYSGVATLKPNSAVVLFGELDKSQSRAISGTPGLDSIPGLSETDNRDTNKSFASLLVVITPRILRGPQAGGNTVMMHVERGNQAGSN